MKTPKAVDSTQKQILIILRTPAGGIRQQVLAQIDYFLAKGDQVVFVTDAATGDLAFQAWRKKLKPVGFALQDQTILREPSLRDFVQIFVLWWTLRTKEFDVIHGHGTKGGWLARWLKLFFPGAKVFYSPHGGSFHFNFGIVKNRIYQWVEWFLLLFTHGVFAESQYTLDQFRRYVSQRFQNIWLIPNALVEDRGTRDIVRNVPQDIFLVRAFGILRDLKGFDLLIEAASKLVGAIPNLRIEIFGEGPERFHLENMIQQAGLTKVVFLKGETSQPMLEMAKAHLVVVPSRFESFGLVALEALSLGVPVLAADVGGLREVTQNGEWAELFAAGESDDLAQKILKVNQNYKASADRAKKGSDAVRVVYGKTNTLARVYERYETEIN